MDEKRKLIKINNEFSIYKDSRQWCTVRFYESEYKGKTTTKEEVKYPGSIENCCGYIIQHSLGGCSTLEDMKELLINARNILSIDVRKLIEGDSNE